MDASSPSTDDTDDSPGRHWTISFAKDIVIGISIVIVIVGIFFLISGVWPPFVAIESGSMEPHMSEGDLVYLVEYDRFGSYDGVGDTNLVTTELGEEIGHIAFGKPGDVVVFKPDGEDGTPIIHRLHLWVEEGENWYDRANPDYIGDHDSCEALPDCPAPHDGFITKGDHNSGYDQVNGQTTVVKPEWIEGKAQVRLPWLGHLRLTW